MKKIVTSLCLVLSLTLGFTLLPAFSPAAEFSYPDPPAFTVTYPATDVEKVDATPPTVWAIKYPGEFFVDAAVEPIPQGIDLKDVAEKAYKPGFEAYQKSTGGLTTGTTKLSENKEITLDGGIKAFYSELTWTHAPSGTPIVTMVVSAYKDGKWIRVTAHPYDNFKTYEKIVKSLKFK